MKSKHNKKPQIHKSKEELLNNLRGNADFQLKMKFIKEQFYPALLEASTSIEDASTLLSGFNSTIMEKFLGLMKEKKVSELDLYSRLDVNAPKHEQHKKLLELFSDMDVFQAKEYIEGMRNEIEQFKLDEFRERPLDTLKTKWLDEL